MRWRRLLQITVHVYLYLTLQPSMQNRLGSTDGRYDTQCVPITTSNGSSRSWLKGASYNADHIITIGPLKSERGKKDNDALTRFEGEP